jgi:hypothetical protein
MTCHRASSVNVEYEYDNEYDEYDGQPLVEVDDDYEN